MGATRAPVARFEIRAFGEADRSALVALWRRCDLTRSWNDPDRDIDRKLALADGLLLVGVRTGELVASVMAGYDGHRGWINYLAVAPEEQGAGIGRAMVVEAERRLRSVGCPKVNLQIRRSNAEAVDFYEALGYEHDEVISMGRRLIED